MADELNKSLEGMVSSFEADRQKSRKSYIILVSIGVPMIVIGIVLFLLAFLYWDNTAVVATGLILCIVGTILTVIGTTIKSNFSKRLITSIKNQVNSNLFPKAVISPNQGMLLKKVMEPGFFATPDRYLASDYMTATYEGISFEQGKYRLQRRETHTDSHGNTTTSYNDYAVGTMYRFQYERDFGQIVKVLEKAGTLSFGGGGLKKVETEYIAFNKKFKILASDDTTVFYLLTPQIQEKIMDLEGKFKGQFYLAFIGNELFVAVNDSNTSLQVPFNEKITIESIQPIVECLAIPAVFIKLLGLNKSKFEKNAGVKL
ncbi:MAG: DUF3137 domain-containing protein [Bacilli bacterium]|jgi:hypothetical protein|nr:DUF3137 domain-containing protein [Bacilli bacterium]MCH4210906.1 DUF3137 domain-containing protein [Bacilli bacterium]MCH4228115.1 DUF3137 domain-containing protein [Bacilli bacterium]MCH4278383.1 DUF3137 domain-containing protein [Bacilli bacterium]MCI2054579.1 DUF3137 domain-containing protein [Bacilli bacterium]